MKKNILVAGLIAMLSTASVMPVFAREGAIAWGGSSTNAAETDGHWVANRDGSWSFVSNQNGAPIKGWIVNQHQWYFIGDNGRMVTGWQFLNKCWYYFSAQKMENQPVGSLYVNKVTPDGYRVDSNGIWIS